MTTEPTAIEFIAEMFEFTPQQREVLGIGKRTRRPAKCRNWVGSALYPQGPCGPSVVRVAEVGGTRRYNLCEKCALADGPYIAEYVDKGIYTVSPIK